MHELLSLLFLNFLALMSPGPDFAMILKCSLIYGRRAALFCAFGFSLGILIHVAYILLGVSFLISQSPFVFRIIQSLGALYLIYLGLKLLGVKFRKKYKIPQNSSNIELDHEIRTSDAAALRMGFITNILNAKASLFLFSIFSQFIHPKTTQQIKILYGLLMSFSTFLWFAFLAIVLTIAAFRKRIQKVQKYAEKIMGIILILLGVRLIVYF